MTSIDWSDPDALTRAYRDAEACCQSIVEKCERMVPLSVRDVTSVAQWVGIAQGVMSERAHALERLRLRERQEGIARQNGTSAEMHPSYCRRHGREDCTGCAEERSPGETCVLEALGAVTQSVLMAWASNADFAFRQMVARAELFRRGLGPDPRLTPEDLSRAAARERADAGKEAP